MKFDYNGATYRIRFQYNKGTDSLGEEVMVTTAFIEQPLQDHGTGKSDTIIALGTAKQCSLDRFDKETGRKLALSRALAYTTGESGKAYRKLVWEAYHRRPGGVLSKTAGDTA